MTGCFDVFDGFMDTIFYDFIKNPNENSYLERIKFLNNEIDQMHTTNADFNS